MTTDKKTTSKSLDELLVEVQTELKAPKGLRNTFGNYNYRSTESILESVKPLLSDRGLLLTISDQLEVLGDRYYVKAEARLSKGGDVITVSAFAREEEVKKGMDSSQVTGATSSYARKYALNGLFLIDDTKDPDSDEYQGKSTKTATTSAPIKSTNDLPWLNKGSEDYAKVEKALTDKKATIEDVLKKFKLSSVVRKELEKIS